VCERVGVDAWVAGFWLPGGVGVSAGVLTAEAPIYRGGVSLGHFKWTMINGQRLTINGVGVRECVERRMSNVELRMSNLRITIND
jgi:hypothetical protein